MTDRIERKLFCHAETDKALLLSPTSLYHEAERLGDWFPRSQLEITAADVRHGGRQLVTFLAPRWLMEKRRQMPDAEPGHPFGYDAHAQGAGA